MAMSWATSYVPATLDIDHPEWLALFSPFLLKTKIETWRPSNQRSMWWNPYQMLELTRIPQYPLPPLLSKAVFTKDRNICKVEALEGGFCLHVLFFFFLPNECCFLVVTLRVNQRGRLGKRVQVEWKTAPCSWGEGRFGQGWCRLKGGWDMA